MASGLLLTGGTSRRMGRDKASVELGGRTLALRAATALSAAASPTLVVGHDAGTRLEAVRDRLEGPLAALVDGAAALTARGGRPPVLLLAADMPFVTAELLDHLVAALGDADAAVPVTGGRDQPLSACYSRAAVERAGAIVAGGGRAMHELIASLDDVVRIQEPEWTKLAGSYALLDVDSPEDLEEARRILDSPV